MANKSDISRTATCLILDESSYVLARGIHSITSEGTKAEIKVFDGDANSLYVGRIVQILFVQKEGEPRLGQVITTRGEMLTVDFLRTLDSQVRRNLRIPIKFETLCFINTETGQAKSRIISNDLSCGGISFYSQRPFSYGETIEIIIPNTNPNPIIVNAEILRLISQKDDVYLYAAKFVDLINDIEAKIRETVFSIQLKQR